ncbi:MAG: response regulator, partial [Planctomycetia bacterium]
IGTDRQLIERFKLLLPEKDDFKLEIAHSGFEAGIQAEAFHPDAIILDLGMGRSEGVQIAANLKRNPAYESCIILALASEDEEEPDSLLSNGFNEVFKKPFDPALLAERLRTLIRQRKDLR